MLMGIMIIALLASKLERLMEMLIDVALRVRMNVDDDKRF